MSQDHEYVDDYGDDLNLSSSAFNVAASDDKGHSVKMFFNTQPALAQQANILAQSGQFPYSSTAALVRHALIRHVRWLQSIAKEGVKIKSVMSQVDLINEAMEEETAKAAFLHTIKVMSRTIGDYVAEDEKGEAIRVLMNCKRRVDAMPDGYWKRRYLAKLAKFDSLVKDAGKANLMELEDD